MQDPTQLGTVESVSGSEVSVALEPNAASGLTYVAGHGYRAGQVGNFVRIAIGLVDLYGVISQIGAGAVPEALAEKQPHGHRWMTVQLVGEALPGGPFERGLSEYPTIGDRVFLRTEDDLRRLYGEPDELRKVRLGQLAGGGSIAARIDIDRLITRHTAVVGATGSGKSSTVARLISRMVAADRYPGARTLLFDLHGEYAAALPDEAVIFSASPRPIAGHERLYVPYWALPLELLVGLTMGGVEDKQLGLLGEMVVELKRETLATGALPGVTADTVTADSPVPFSLKKLWFTLHKLEHATYTKQGAIAQDEDAVAYELDDDRERVQEGNLEDVIAPRYRPQRAGQIFLSARGHNLRRQTDLLGQRLRDPRYGFLLRPGAFEPGENGAVEADLSALLFSWLGGAKPLALLDLSVVPIAVLNALIGAIVNIAYEALLWGRNLSEGGRERPLLMVFEEAHSYLRREQGGLAAEQVRRVVREGRKYGVGAMIVSQRPSELDATVLSQCGTLIALRLSNANDRQQVTGTASDNFQGLLSGLPILRTGEALVLGEAVGMPMRVQVDHLDADRRPDSHDPPVIPAPPLPGGWTQPRPASPDYERVVAAWRAHDARGLGLEEVSRMDRQPVTSSAIVSVGYDPGSETLEVELVDGPVYQYFGVSEQVHEGLLSAESIGKYYNENVRNAYSYARL
jgi:DNA helicase HerA-like ATPase